MPGRPASAPTTCWPARPRRWLVAALASRFNRPFPHLGWPIRTTRRYNARQYQRIKGYWSRTHASKGAQVIELKPRRGRLQPTTGFIAPRRWRAERQRRHEKSCRDENFRSATSPILPYEQQLTRPLQYIAGSPRPLDSLLLLAYDKAEQQRLMEQNPCRRACCINDTILHVGQIDLPYRPGVWPFGYGPLTTAMEGLSDVQQGPRALYIKAAFQRRPADLPALWAGWCSSDSTKTVSSAEVRVTAAVRVLP